MDMKSECKSRITLERASSVFSSMQALWQSTPTFGNRESSGMPEMDTNELRRKDMADECSSYKIWRTVSYVPLQDQQVILQEVKSPM